MVAPIVSPDSSNRLRYRQEQSLLGSIRVPSGPLVGQPPIGYGDKWVLPAKDRVPPRALPPTPVTELRNDPLLISVSADLRQAPADGVVQRLVREHVDEDLAPRDRPSQAPDQPLMDRRGAPGLAGTSVNR